LLRSLGTSENREDYIDNALVEYAAASYHFERAGHRRFQARVENNVGYLYATLHRFEDAHEHLTRARMLHLSVGDRGGAAGAEDTRAQAYLMEGKYEEAEKASRLAVRSLTLGGEQAILAEALTTHATALARLREFPVAKTTLDHAVEIAQSVGNPDRGGIAAVTAIEELSGYLSLESLLNYYSTAESLLSDSQNRSLKTRLGECARRVLAAEFARIKANAPTADVPTMPPGSSLDAEVLRYEGSLIRKALEDSGGSVTRAARLLGVTHQGLAFILNGRHSDLLSIRTPVKKRRRSIIRQH
jgi:tetratricopeptide (TPR) repeat protein